jgi:hypothetical protein
MMAGGGATNEGFHLQYKDSNEGFHLQHKASNDVLLDEMENTVNEVKNANTERLTSGKSSNW